jgi:hypothetical protein
MIWILAIIAWYTAAWLTIKYSNKLFATSFTHEIMALLAWPIIVIVMLIEHLSNKNISIFPGTKK